MVFISVSSAFFTWRVMFVFIVKSIDWLTGYKPVQSNLVIVIVKIQYRLTSRYII